MSYIGTSPSIASLHAVAGQVRYDTSTNQVQMWDGSQWVQVTNNSMVWDQKKLTCEDLKFGNLWFYKVVAEGYDFDELNEWCNQTFGPPRTDQKGTALHKWFISGGDFYFHEEKHRSWFVLKWTADGNNNV
jgi:hypothetical protein